MNPQIIACPDGDLLWVPGALPQLKTWRILRKLRCCRWKAGKLAKTIHALEIHASKGMERFTNDPRP